MNSNTRGTQHLINNKDTQVAKFQLNHSCNVVRAFCEVNWDLDSTLVSAACLHVLFYLWLQRRLLGFYGKSFDPSGKPMLRVCVRTQSQERHAMGTIGRDRARRWCERKKQMYSDNTRAEVEGKKRVFLCICVLKAVAEVILSSLGNLGRGFSSAAHVEEDHRLQGESRR